MKEPSQKSSQNENTESIVNNGIDSSSQSTRKLRYVEPEPAEWVYIAGSDAWRAVRNGQEVAGSGSKPSPKRHIGFCEICKYSVNTYIGNHYAEIHNVMKGAEDNYICYSCGQVLALNEVLGHTCAKKIVTPPTRNDMYREDKDFASIVKPRYSIRDCSICGYRYTNESRHFSIYHSAHHAENELSHCLVCKQEIMKKQQTYHLRNVHLAEFIEKSINLREVNPNPRLLQCIRCGKRLHPFEVEKHAASFCNPKSYKAEVAQPLATEEKARKTMSRAEASKHSQFIADFLNEVSRRQTDTLDSDDEDGGKYLGWHERESGKFGSLPLYDNYDD